LHLVGILFPHIDRLYSKQFKFGEFKWGGLYEKHTAATRNPGNNLRIRVQTEENKKSGVEMDARRTFRVHNDLRSAVR